MRQKSSPHISIIIPVLNEEMQIGVLLEYLRAQSMIFVKEIIVVDGGSSDTTVNTALKQGASVLHAPKGRARQMNLGAKHATGSILYFLHSDTFPPKNFDRRIAEAVRSGIEAGCFRMRFDHKSIFLKFFSWFSRINYRICRGGDQSLFISSRLFQKTGGFNEDYLIYEDNEFIGRLYRETVFTILPQHVRTSARRYELNGFLRLQYHFGMIHLQNYLGAGPHQLYRYYKKNIL